MRQLSQELKSGKMEILEVPIPNIDDNSVLVKNYFSVISAGTEGKTVKDARLGYIGKAKARQKEVKAVIEVAKVQGVLKTIEMVKNKLESYSSLGYSCAGEIIEVGKNVNNFSVGDFVACGGSNAVHAEVVAIPKNLAVKVPKEVDLKSASFTTVASIAIQGIRQADLKFGESCAVIGLGLIGQLTIQILNSAGVKSIGVDIDQTKVNLANEFGAKLALNRNHDGIEKIITTITYGFGVDSVIITAATSSTDPVDFAGSICRKKGKVVIVGAVPTGFSRENYYKKELDLRMSSSYGPGRYDPSYEEKGNDYPIGYVRWTENRNMQYFIDLLVQNKINMDKLITHQFELTDAVNAYNMIVENSSPYIGIILKYNLLNGYKRKLLIRNEKSIQSQKVKIGFIGAGSFAQNMLLPNIPKLVAFSGVATNRGNTSKYIADKYNFGFATTDANEIINNKEINTIFITTRHNLHAEYVIKGLKANKNIFVEKPLCLKENELDVIKKLYDESNSSLMLGYNRRFSSFVQKIKARTLNEFPKAINYRINAGYIPKEHWTQVVEIGGGRIIGEVCHFVDLAMFIAGSQITSISAVSADTGENLHDILSVQIKFENGSIANIAYYANGSKKLSKEYLEVFYAGTTFIIDDFREMKIYSEKVEKLKLSTQDKGHKEEIKSFINSINNGEKSPISFSEIFNSTLATFKILESIKTRKIIYL